MDSKKIIDFCARFWNVNPSFIKEEIYLDDRSLPNNSSIRFFQFIATMESELKVYVDNVHEINTFGDLFLNIKELP